MYYVFQKQGNEETTIINYRMEGKTMGIIALEATVGLAAALVEAVVLSF